MRIKIGDQRLEVPDDLAHALLTGLQESPIVPPTASDFDDLVDLVERLQGLISHLGTVKEVALARADASGAYANRRTLSTAASMAPSQLSRVLMGHGLPTDRRRGGVDLVIAFRTDDGVLHGAEEKDIEHLPSFHLPAPRSTCTAGRASAPNGYTGRDLTCYYRPQVPVSAAALGRSAGYTLRSTQAGLAACMTEPVFNALFGDPRVDPTRSKAR